jgi:predicted nucleic acid-binding protein
MKKIIVDTNIIIDFIANRKPFSKFAIQIFDKAEKKTVSLYTSSHSIATTHYLLKKYIEKKIKRIDL